MGQRLYLERKLKVGKNVSNHLLLHKIHNRIVTLFANCPWSGSSEKQKT